jgi:hypothetical protein
MAPNCLCVPGPGLSLWSHFLMLPLYRTCSSHAEFAFHMCYDLPTMPLLILSPSLDCPLSCYLNPDSIHLLRHNLPLSLPLSLSWSSYWNPLLRSHDILMSVKNMAKNEAFGSGLRSNTSFIISCVCDPRQCSSLHCTLAVKGLWK